MGNPNFLGKQSKDKKLAWEKRTCNPCVVTDLMKRPRWAVGTEGAHCHTEENFNIRNSLNVKMDFFDKILKWIFWAFGLDKSLSTTEVLGRLGPGQLGPGQLGPGQLGPGQPGPWTIGPRTVGPLDSWAPDSWAPGPNCPPWKSGQLGHWTVGPWSNI